MGTKVRLCIIVNGLFVNKVHSLSLCSFMDVEIVGICALNKVRLKQTAGNFNIPEKNIYVAKSRFDFQQMLINLRPDGVYVIGQSRANV